LRQADFANGTGFAYCNNYRFKYWLCHLRINAHHLRQVNITTEKCSQPILTANSAHFDTVTLYCENPEQR